MLDRDHPITARQRTLTVGALLVGGAVGIALFGGLIPGLRPNFTPPEFQTFEGRSYYWTQVLVPAPPLGANASVNETATVHNTTFQYWSEAQLAGTLTYLKGVANVPHGSSYPFVVGGGLVPAERTTQYVSADHEVAVLWMGGPTAEFLLLAP